MGSKLFLVRHGETVWNLEARYQGITNTGLTSEGLKQAELAAKYLSKVNFSGFYSSPLGRTIETAEVFKKVLKKSYEVRENLKELSFGKWEGLIFDDIIAKYNNDFQNWIRNPFEDPPTGGESFNEIINRGKQEIVKILSENEDGSNILLVTHGGFIVAMLVYWLKISPERWSSIIQSHGAINVVVIDKEIPYISQINFTGHLFKYYSSTSDRIIKNYSKLRR
ncbi:MAG: histidine phosphatase family protein [Actinobacteria bacterium]|nr:histidine phosphatase family protein [Actinomycetota bacterium]